jgi:hypothetical protein
MRAIGTLLGWRGIKAFYNPYTSFRGRGCTLRGHRYIRSVLRSLDGCPCRMAEHAHRNVLGASLAAAIGVWLFYYQGQKAEEARVEQLREALIAELYATIDRLSTTPSTQIPDIRGGEPDLPVVITSVEPTVCEEAIRSALFGHRNTVTPTQLARLMREYTKAADLLSSLLYSPQINATWFAQRLYIQATNTKGLQQFVILFCETALKGFEAQGIELPPSERYYSDPDREAPPDFVSYDQ